jgi:hypothetical protein
MTTQLTKRSKAAFYKHRLDKAMAILHEVKKVSVSFEYIGVEQIFELEDAINEINFKIDNLLEDIDNED